MTSQPTGGPTWYDVLGVERDASAEQVRTAWRQATDRAEPGSTQFRSANQAAETLLDPARRAAYDATLAPQTDDRDAPEHDVAQDLDPGREEEQVEDRETPPPASRSWVERRRERPGDAPVGRLTRLLGSLPLWVMALLVLLTVAVGALVIWLGTVVAAQAAEADARVQAPVAAEQAAVAMLSYDHRQLAEDRARAEGYLTGDFKEEFLKNFALLEEQDDGSPGLAVQTKTVTTAQVQDSGVMGVDDDGRTVRVLLFVNQTSEKQGQDPQVFLNRVAMTMTKQGERWLVSDLQSY